MEWKLKGINTISKRKFRPDASVNRYGYREIGVGV
jgi:hypothetical protein